MKKLMKEDKLVSLEEALDKYPCEKCGAHYDKHYSLTKEEIWDARDQGCVVNVCREACEKYFCRVLPSPDNPCDNDFMEDISS